MKGRKVVLIAEDDPTLLKALAMVLDEEFEVYRAENGRVAWDFVQKNRIDCLITDMDMPEMSGLELIEKIRSSGNNCSIIVTTGLPTPALRKECENLGITDFLAKPYNMFSLKKIINGSDEPLIMKSAE